MDKIIFPDEADGLCFNCHRAGHFSRNCPDLNKVSSSSRGIGPPGVSTFGVNIDYGVIEDQHEWSQASKANLSLGAISFNVEDDGLEPDMELPDLWDESASEGSDDGDDMTDPSEGVGHICVPVYSNGVWVQDLIFSEGEDPSESEDDTTDDETSSTTTESLSFDFKVQYVPGEDNILPNALSQLYEFNASGTMRAPSEFVEHDLP